MMSWREGQGVCETQGGYLAEIKTEEQQVFLVSQGLISQNINFFNRKVWQCFKRTL